VDVEAISSFDRPSLLSDGDQSPPLFSRVIERLESVLPNAERRRISGAGPVPHLTHPALYADMVAAFALALHS
jgi:hypothetical protein